MEKIKNTNKSEKISEVLLSKKAKYIIGTVLLSGIGIALPRIFHVLAGSSAGAIFLPMHIAVLIAALTFGISSSLIVAITSVGFSYLLTGMPSLARFPYMLAELIIYSVLLGLFNKKYNYYISLIMTIIIGRILYAVMFLVATDIFGFSTYGITVFESVKMSILGIILQLVTIPVIAKFMNERLNLKNE